MNTNLYVKVKTEHTKKNTKVVIEREAEISGATLTFGAIASFGKAMDKINTLLKTAIKENRYTEMFVLCSDYMLNNESGTMDYSDCWEYKGWLGDDNLSLNADEVGVYLSPDTRYTPSHRDCWYNFTLDSLPSDTPSQSANWKEGERSYAKQEAS